MFSALEPVCSRMRASHALWSPSLLVWDHSPVGQGPPRASVHLTYPWTPDRRWPELQHGWGSAWPLDGGRAAQTLWLLPGIQTSLEAFEAVKEERQPAWVHAAGLQAREAGSACSVGGRAATVLGRGCDKGLVTAWAQAPPCRDFEHCSLC